MEVSNVWNEENKCKIPTEKQQQKVKEKTKGDKFYGKIFNDVRKKK